MSLISKLYFSPVKSLSFQPVNQCKIIKNIGIKYDREIAFTRMADFKFAKELETISSIRNHKNFLSLKFFRKALTAVRLRKFKTSILRKKFFLLKPTFCVFV